MKTNEKTSKRVSAIAGRLSRRIATLKRLYDIDDTSTAMVRDKVGWRTVGSIGDLAATAASALTQAADKPLRTVWPSNPKALLDSLAYTQPVKAKKKKAKAAK